MPLTRDIKKVMVGPAALFIGPEDEDVVADSVALFAGWDDPWTHPGLTNEGVNSSFERDLTFHYVEEQSAPARVTVNTSTFSFATALAEDTLDNYKLAAGGGTLTKTAPGPAQIGQTEYAHSDDLDIVAIGLEAENTFGFFRRMHVPRCVSTGTVEINNRRSDSKRVYAATFQSISDMSEIIMKDKTAAATG